MTCVLNQLTRRRAFLLTVSAVLYLQRELFATAGMEFEHRLIKQALFLLLKSRSYESTDRFLSVYKLNL
jgi:hypothetical protein